jgi:hypothetical protein
MASLADKKKALDWSKRNTQGFEGILDVNQFLPVTGDIQSGIMAGQDLQKGNYGSAALNSLGLLPFIPALGGVIAKNIPSKTTFETAQETAQRNAALPVSEGGLGLPTTNTAAQRAEAMNYPNINQAKNYNYHTSRSGIEGNIDPSKSDLGFHIGTEEQALDRAMTLGQLYGKGERYLPGSTTNPLLIRRDANFLPVIDEGSFHAYEIAPQFEAKGYLPKGYTEKMLNKINDNSSLMSKYDQEMRNIISKKGYQGVKYNNASEGEGVSYAITDPSSIRSPFAAFDPFRRNEADILAGVAAAPIGLLAVDKEKTKKKRSNK